ncbi:hypothetical protein [Xanthomonas translucens]
MKSKLILFAAVVSVVLAGCGKKENPVEESGFVASKPAASAGNESETSSAVSPVSQQGVGSRVQSRDAKQYLCQRGANACKASGPLVANSEAEAQWLLSNGYPTEAELARLDRMGLEQLKAESQAGNKAATVIYGKKTAIDGGRFQEGLGILRGAASSGSLYAYYGLSEIYAGDTKNKNMIDSAAYLRLAYLLGDGKASADIALRGLSSVESVAADERAASLYKTFSKYQRPSPRPIE